MLRCSGVQSFRDVTGTLTFWLIPLRRSVPRHAEWKDARPHRAGGAGG